MRWILSVVVVLGGCGGAPEPFGPRGAGGDTGQSDAMASGGAAGATVDGGADAGAAVVYVDLDERCDDDLIDHPNDLTPEPDWSGYDVIRVCGGTLTCAIGGRCSCGSSCYRPADLGDDCGYDRMCIPGLVCNETFDVCEQG